MINFKQLIKEEIMAAKLNAVIKKFIQIAKKK